MNQELLPIAILVFFGVVLLNRSMTAHASNNRLTKRVVKSLFEQTEFLEAFWAQYEPDITETSSFHWDYYDALEAVLPKYHLRAIFKLTDDFVEVVSIDDLAMALEKELKPKAWAFYSARTKEYYRSLANEGGTQHG